MAVFGRGLVALLLFASASGCAGQRTASLATCALAGAGVGLAAGTAYGGFEGGEWKTEDAAVGAAIGLGGGAIIGAMICALIPERSDAPRLPPEPPVAPLPDTIDETGTPAEK